MGFKLPSSTNPLLVCCSATFILPQGRQPGSLSSSPTPFSSSSSSPQGTPATSCGVEVGVSLEAAAALLDGATPLHCAAIRGNPAQVDHLLYCGADPTMRTAAGELPLQLVPVCGHRLRGSTRWACRCLAPADQEVRVLRVQKGFSSVHAPSVDAHR